MYVYVSLKTYQQCPKRIRFLFYQYVYLKYTSFFQNITLLFVDNAVEAKFKK